MNLLANGMGLDPVQFLMIGVVAFLGAVLGGISGFGAGLIVTPFLLPVVGVKAVVPVMSIAMMFGNLSRLWVYRPDQCRGRPEDSRPGHSGSCSGNAAL
jgi:uncharacterized protein